MPALGHSIESERRFQLLVDAVTDYAVYMLDPDGQVVSWNSGAERIKGYTDDEIIGQHFSRFFTEEDRVARKPQRALRTARETGRWEDEAWRVRKDGSRFWASAVLDAIRDTDGTLIGFAKVTRDITERRNAQRALEEAREQLFQSQKLEALGQLTGGVAHDFNNLLMVILGNLELAAVHGGDRSHLQRYHDAIRTAAQRAAELTQQLLAFSRRQPLRREIINLTERFPQALDLIRRSLRGDTGLAIEIAEDLWPIEVDPTQLELALLNVALNGRDAMPEGGELRVLACNVESDLPAGLAAGRYVMIRITDTGTGIPPDIMLKVVEPFFTTKEVGKGSGLGLSQAHGFAAQSGGLMSIESDVGNGTSVTFYLRAADTGHVAAHREPILTDEVATGATVLLVEDNPDLSRLSAELLLQAGYAVTVADGPAQALEMLTRETPVDLVFTDIVMPGGMSGVELGRVIRRLRPGMPVLLTTGYSTAAAAAAQEFPLLSKPYAVDRLVREIGRLIAVSRVVRPLRCDPGRPHDAAAASSRAAGRQSGSGAPGQSRRRS